MCLVVPGLNDFACYVHGEAGTCDRDFWTVSVTIGFLVSGVLLRDVLMCVPAHTSRSVSW